MSKFRIKQESSGYIVQIKKWFGWKHFISVWGIPSIPWYHKTYQAAMDSLLEKIENETKYESHKRGWSTL